MAREGHSSELERCLRFRTIVFIHFYNLKSGFILQMKFVIDFDRLLDKLILFLNLDKDRLFSTRFR